MATADGKVTTCINISFINSGTLTSIAYAFSSADFTVNIGQKFKFEKNIE